MSITTEELREALLDLERAKDKERQARLTSESLLAGLEAISETISSDEMFSRLLEALRIPLDFDHAFLILKDDDKFRIVASTSPHFEKTGFQAKPLLNRILEGKAVSVFDAGAIKEWQIQPESARALVTSALHVPLKTSQLTAALVCVKRVRAYFTRSHLSLIKRFIPLALSALGRLQDMERLKCEIEEHEQTEAKLSEYRDRLEKMVEERTRELLQSQERLQAALLGSKAGLWDVNLITGEEFLDQRWTGMLGYSVQELWEKYEKPWEALVHPEDFPGAQTALHRHLAGKTEYYQAEYRMRAKSGEFRWILDTAKAGNYDEHGAPGRISGIHLDITERKKTEIALKRSEQRFADFVDAASDWYWEMDADYRMCWLSDRIEDVLGVSKEELLGFKRTEVRSEKEAEEHEKWDAHIADLDHQRTFRDFEYQLKGDQYGNRWVRISGKPFYDDNGEYLGYRGTGTDITAYRKAEEERIELEEQLRQSKKMEAIGTLAGGIAHDFNNILQGMASALEIINMELPKKTPVKPELQMLARLQKRARDLVRQILTFSRYDTEKQGVIEVVPILQESLKMLRSTLPKSIDIQTQIVLPQALIQGNASQIHQVIVNLCVNAGHAMEKTGGVLTVSLDKVEHPAREPVSLHSGRNYFRLCIKDTGTGMSEDLVKRIFEPFFTTKDRGRGSGLGLSVIDGIIELHQGHIHVASEEGKGSTFSVFLPLVEGKISKSPAAAVPETPPKPEGFRILFVDDEEEILFMQQNILKRMKHQVTACVSGEDALEKLRKDPDAFDMVITDQTMPGVSGMQLSRLIREVRQDMLIILATGYSAEELPEGIEDVGIRAILRKPYTHDILSSLIHEVMETA